MPGHYGRIPVTPNIYGLRTFSDTVPGHPFWHTAYIGLGYESNKYGITYLDASAYNYVKKVDPRAAFLSPAAIGPVWSSSEPSAPTDTETSERSVFSPKNS